MGIFKYISINNFPWKSSAISFDFPWTYKKCVNRFTIIFWHNIIWLEFLMLCAFDILYENVVSLEKNPLFLSLSSQIVLPDSHAVELVLA